MNRSDAGTLLLHYVDMLKPIKITDDGFSQLVNVVLEAYRQGQFAGLPDAPMEEEPVTAFEKETRTVLIELGDLLIAKNRKYGDAALDPWRIFSRASAVEQIRVRLDDKLSRLANQQPDEDEDVEWDLMGYLVLLRIAKRRQQLEKHG